MPWPSVVGSTTAVFLAASALYSVILTAIYNSHTQQLRQSAITAVGLLDIVAVAYEA